MHGMQNVLMPFQGAEGRVDLAATREWRGGGSFYIQACFASIHPYFSTDHFFCFVKSPFKIPIHSFSNGVDRRQTVACGGEGLRGGGAHTNIFSRKVNCKQKKSSIMLVLTIISTHSCPRDDAGGLVENTSSVSPACRKRLLNGRFPGITL